MQEVLGTFLYIDIQYRYWYWVDIDIDIDIDIELILSWYWVDIDIDIDFFDIIRVKLQKKFACATFVVYLIEKKFFCSKKNVNLDDQKNYYFFSF